MHSVSRQSVKLASIHANTEQFSVITSFDTVNVDKTFFATKSMFILTTRRLLLFELWLARCFGENRCR